MTDRPSNDTPDSKTATFIRDLTGFAGKAKLYKVDPPVEYGYEEPLSTTDHVAVSATTVPYSGRETYIFPANAEGEVIGWSEMEGSYRGGLDHVTALTNAGYEVAQ